MYFGIAFCFVYESNNCYTLHFSPMPLTICTLKVISNVNSSASGNCFYVAYVSYNFKTYQHSPFIAFILFIFCISSFGDELKSHNVAYA